jgi:hypothetical protein
MSTRPALTLYDTREGHTLIEVTVNAYIVKKRDLGILVALTNSHSHVSSEVYPLPRFDGMALNNVHYAVEVERSARLSAVRWTVAGKLNEQLVWPARQTGEFFLPLLLRGL